jgi:uncharacterized protein YndB with AHSA1/START domain
MQPIIHRRARLACDPQTAFAHFTQDDLLVKFFTNEAAVEPRVGGKYELAWDPPNKPDDSTVGCQITAIAPGELLAFDWKGPTQFDATMNHVRPLTHVVVAFHEVHGNGSPATDVNIIHSGWRPGPDWEDARAYFERAWGLVLDALVELIGSPAPLSDA